MNTLTRLIFAVTLLYSIHGYSLEITPVVGFIGGGAFVNNDTDQRHSLEKSNSSGFIIGISDETDKQLEMYYGQQTSHIHSVDITVASSSSRVDIPLTIDFVHLGGTTPITHYKIMNTYLSGGVGFSYLSPDFTGLESDLRASINLGLGMKWPFSKHIGLRLEMRGLGILFDSRSVLFCDDRCSLTVKGKLFLQAEVIAGMAIKF